MPTSCPGIIRTTKDTRTDALVAFMISRGHVVERSHTATAVDPTHYLGVGKAHVETVCIGFRVPWAVSKVLPQKKSTRTALEFLGGTLYRARALEDTFKGLLGKQYQDVTPTLDLRERQRVCRLLIKIVHGPVPGIQFIVEVQLDILRIL